MEPDRATWPRRVLIVAASAVAAATVQFGGGSLLERSVPERGFTASLLVELSEPPRAAHHAEEVGWGAAAWAVTDA